MRLPIVAIVGRQNVGKSSLLNAIAGRRLSIVDPMPGVTRDRVTVVVQALGVPFEVVDTAGMGLAPEDRFYESVERQIGFAIDKADLVVFVVDAIEGVTALDRQVAGRLRKAGKPAVLVANKADTPAIEAGCGQFGELGYGDAITVSCAHQRRISDLLEVVVGRLPRAEVRPFQALRVAIAGKRNVGKSTFVNALAGEERVIVSEVPGTTRDAIDVHLEREGHHYVLVDTAGLRKKGKAESTVELWSRVRTEEAVGRADAVVLMLDVTERVTEVDKRIAGFIEERKKPVAIALNKWDLVPRGHTPAEFAAYIDSAMPVLAYAPVLMISARGRQRVWEVLEVVRELHEQAGVRIPTPEVNRVCEAAQRERSPGTRGPRPPKIFYATQSRSHPPTFTVFVNDPRNFTPDYVRFLERKFREYLPFHEVPIRLALRARRAARKAK
jgi:GTP-binding protein